MSILKKKVSMISRGHSVFINSHHPSKQVEQPSDNFSKDLYLYFFLSVETAIFFGKIKASRSHFVNEF